MNGLVEAWERPRTAGIRYIWLVPFFILVYGPILLAARCAGAWVGVRDVRQLRRAQIKLEHAGLDPNSILARGLELPVATATQLTVAPSVTPTPVPATASAPTIEPRPTAKQERAAPIANGRSSRRRHAGHILMTARRFGWQPYAAAAAGAGVALLVANTLPRATSA